MPNKDERDELPTMVITDQDGYLVQVGDPSVPKKSELGNYARKGYKIQTVTFKEYKAKNLKWCFDKSNQ